MGKRPGVHFAFFLCCFYRRGYGVEGMRGQETASVALFCYFTSNVLGLLPPVCSTRPQSFSRTTSCQVFGGQLGKAPWHCTWRSPGVLPSRQNSVKLWAFVLWLGTLKEHKVFCVRLVSGRKCSPTASKAVPSCLWEAAADYNHFPDDLTQSFFSPEHFQELSRLKFFPPKTHYCHRQPMLSLDSEAKGQSITDSERWMRGQASFRCNPSYQQQVSASLLPLRPEVIHGRLDHLKESLTRLSFTFSIYFCSNLAGDQVWTRAPPSLRV